MTLDENVIYYAKQGFQVRMRTDTAVQMVKPKRFHAMLFLVLTILFVFPGILYLFAYWGQKDESLYLYVGEDGEVHREGGKWTLGKAVERKLHGAA